MGVDGGKLTSVKEVLRADPREVCAPGASTTGYVTFSMTPPGMSVWGNFVLSSYHMICIFPQWRVPFYVSGY